MRRAYGDGTMSSLDATNSCREERSVSVEENKALVRRFVEAQANADLDTLKELLPRSIPSSPTTITTSRTKQPKGTR